jgi:uncharacterized membrane protein YkoI
MKNILSALASAMLAVMSSSAGATSAENLALHATVQMPQAQEIALKARPGQVVAGVLEEKAGGSGLRYVFKINTGEVTYQVDVDARTGNLLQNAIEPLPEATTAQ